MKKIYDFIGVGIGPYNLSLAALSEDIEEIEGIFFEETVKLEWHPGMLIEDTNLQTPFLADLVTFADPTNKYSYLNYLHKHKRLYKFFFLHNLEVPRKEYNDYLQWAADQMDHLYFGKKVVDVVDGNGYYEVVVKTMETGEMDTYYAKHLVLATGAEPLIVEGMEGYPEEDVFHTSRYLFEKEQVLDADSITIVGSGQSAAEVFADLLAEREAREFQLTWLTRSEGIFQLEAAKLGQEFFSPDYVSYFHALDLSKRKDALEMLDALRNGIDHRTLNDIYHRMYEYSVGNKNVKITIQPLTEVRRICKENNKYLLECRQWQTEQEFDYKTEKVIVATGYKPRIPDWLLENFQDDILWEDDLLFHVGRNYELTLKDERDYRMYVVTNIEHTHGPAATNLGLAVQRNMEILNDMMGEKYFDTEGPFIFQQFKQ